MLLVRAIEAEDPAATLLTRDDREYATGAALAQVGADAGRAPDRGAFLAMRSRFALDRLESRYPSVGQAERRARWPGWIGWTLPLAALAVGWASNEVFDGRRLNIISFPLVSLLAWNLVVYAFLIVGALRAVAARARGGEPGGSIAGFLARLARPLRPPPSAQPTLARGIARFVADWLRFSSALNRARASRTLHLAAACLAAGVVLGMYASGWDVEYRAGWESTWIRDPGTLHALLTAVLGPASSVTGIALPTAAELPALNWRAGHAGENAAPWIHLYAATALIFIVGPRLLLAAAYGAQAAHGRQRVPVPGAEDFYVRTLLRSVDGAGASVRVVPYSFALSEAVQRIMRRLLTDVLGERARITIEPAIAYGGEDDWLANAHVERNDDDYLLVLFNLSATPETENHGALVAGIRQRLAKGRRGAAFAVLIDEAAMRRHLRAQAGAEARLEARRQAWHAVLRPHGLEPVLIDVDGDNPSALAQSIEAGLMRSTTERAA